MDQSKDLSGLRMTLILYVVIFVIKLGVYFATGVMALLAEALHTLSDVFVAGFLVVALVYSRRKADETHMFGYGRAQNVGALVAATLFISFTSFELYREAIPHLFENAHTVYQNLGLAVGVLLLSMVIAALPLVTLFRQKKRGAAANAQMLELFNDQFGLLAALLGTLAIQWGFPLGDPLAAMAVATIIAFNAVKLFRENLSMLIGRSPGKEYIQQVKTLALSVPGVQEVHAVRAEYIGPQEVHVILHIRVDPRTPVVEANRIAEMVEKRVYQTETNPDYCTVHVDPGKEVDVTPNPPESETRDE